mmetsp:Transcript_23123/g.38223  ORF Transcript_23123/g.38223 Transcript_23123/m.38223 type:complete len:552 (+) Transcript_23123:176-1831(+)|eukprot:CAMPEP_0119010584 /NCGR_PEP_ID=MMETSP1176-20130426/5110_1 /TAXON_ID=265551 /ORGANISM="Synedropsis recta cf, Strain CCMP1620" /LENGTH=551 /DNA_ID=CAMNT_0006963273 /DNA_START=171 /DNA_END=1826 /DNA_ORIENTATION=+
MLKRLQLVLDIILLGALVLPMDMCLASSNVADFVAHPFTTRGGVTTIANKKPITRKSVTPAQVMMASRSVKVPQFPNYAWEGSGGGIDYNDSVDTPHATLHQDADDSSSDDTYEYSESDQYDDDQYDDDDDDFETGISAQAQLLQEQAAAALTNRNNEHASVLYRYFAKSRSRLRNHDSIPFIFIGPSLDHWKEVGQNLASRGFSVMACERPEGDTDDQTNTDTTAAASGLVEEILEALRWNRAILVGCDREAVMAIRAALQLAPKGRVAGLILCGDLTDVQQSDTCAGGDDIDAFLQEHCVHCPYSVIWDGAAPLNHNYKLSAAAAASDAQDSSGGGVEHHRCLIRGGGSAPHRRLPEQFAWALTRFVEEQVAPVRGGGGGDALTTVQKKRRGRKFLDKLVTPGGLLVVGRVLAEAVFYVSAMKVVLYQYENIYWGTTKVYRGYKTLFSVWPKRALRLLGALVGASSTSKNRIVVPQEEVLLELQPEEFLTASQDETPDDPASQDETHDEEVVPEPAPVEEQVEEQPEAPKEEERHTSFWPIPLLNPITV